MVESVEDRIAIPIPGTEDLLILQGIEDLHPDFRAWNLTRRRADGSLVWSAELPEVPEHTGFDGYVSAEWNRGRVFANSWSGYWVEIDPATGRVIDQQFTR